MGHGVKQRNNSKTPQAADFDRAIEEAMAETADPVSPCDACRFLTRCRDESLACDSYAMFKAGFAQARISIAPRVPSRARWEALQIVAGRPKRKRRPVVAAVEAAEEQ